MRAASFLCRALPAIAAGLLSGRSFSALAQPQDPAATEALPAAERPANAGERPEEEVPAPDTGREEQPSSPPAPPATGAPPPHPSVEPGSPSEGPEQPKKDSWLDTGHAKIEQFLFKPVIEFDRFFSDEGELELERSRSFLRLRNELRFREDGPPVYSANLRANLRFPGLSEWLGRLRLVLAGETENGSTLLPEEAAAGVALPDRDVSRANFELRFGALESFLHSVDLGAGVLLDLPPGVFTRVRYRAAIPIERLLLVRFATSGFWRSDTALGTRVDLGLERPLGPATLARLGGSSQVSQRKTRGIEYGSELVLLQSLGPRSALALGSALEGASRSPVAVDRYRVFARYRRDFFRRWIFVELEPELGWPWSVDRGRHREIAGTVRLEVQFQGQDPSEAASSHAQDVAEPTTTSPVARPR